MGTRSTAAWVLIASVLSGCLLADAVHAQSYPVRPIRIVVGFSPGGASDITTRILGQKLSERYGQPVIIDNRAGASGTIAARTVARSAPDGYTLLSGATSILAINPGLTPNLEYDPLKDFAPVSQTVSMPQLLVVHPSVKAASVQELVAVAKARPDELNYSSSGAGSSSHLAMELLKYMAGLRLVHVPYKGSGQSMPALLAGQVQLIFDPMPTSLPHVKAGRLRALAISTARRSPALPQLATVAESGVPGYESNLWYGVLLPAGASRRIVTQLHKAVHEILASAEVAKRYAELGADPESSTPEAFREYIAREIAKWGTLIRSAGIRAD